MSDLSLHAPLIKRFETLTILCIGDIMLDRFIYGEVQRISPEAPIPVLKTVHEREMLGGVGNVARNLEAAGARTILASACGQDAEGEQIAALLEDMPGVQAHLHRESNRKSTVKTRFFGGRQQMLRADRESSGTAAPEVRRTILDILRNVQKKVDAVILSDYGKGLLSRDLLRDIIKIATRAGLPVVVDPKGRDYTPYRSATLVTPNCRELSEATGMKVRESADVVAAAEALMEATGIRNVLVTRSAEGMTYVDTEGTPTHLPARARDVFDVSGAGDTVAAFMAAGLGAKADPTDAAALANIAGGIVVEKVGTAVARREEVLEALRHEDVQETENRILPRPRALEQVTRWRAEGRKIGFTNGCFDLIHPGHVSLLRQARRQCDRLVVGLNSDASVAALKGESRPVQPESARGIVLSSLESVDLVVVFNEETPLKLIEALRPDVLIKGSDYTEDTVVGADVVREYGGRVFLAELEEGHSTTRTVKRLQGTDK